MSYEIVKLTNKTEIRDSLHFKTKNNNDMTNLTKINILLSYLKESKNEFDAGLNIFFTLDANTRSKLTEEIDFPLHSIEASINAWMRSINKYKDSEEV